jgi:protein tyrosine kinase modulator
MTRRELTPADYLAMLRRRWVLITVLAVIGAPLAYGLARILPAKYTSQTLVLVQPPTVSPNIVEPVDLLDIGQRLASLQQELLSRTRLEPIIRQLGLFPNDIHDRPMDELVERLQKDIEVSPVHAMAETRADNLPGFYVDVTMANPQTAQQVCTAITSMFIAESLRLQNQRSVQTTDFLSQQLADAKTNLDAQDSKLAAFKLRYIGTLPDEAQTNLSILNGLNTQLDSVTQSLARAQQDKSFAESLLTQQRAAWQEAQSGHNPETFEQQLAALQTNLVNLRARYTDDYPDVIKTKADIAALRKQIAESDQETVAAETPKVKKAVVEPASITQLRSQVLSDQQIIADDTHAQEKLKSQIEVYENRVQSSPLVEQKYKELTRGYQTALDNYNDLLKKKETSVMSGDLTRQQQGEQFSILDPANLPDTPSFPNPVKFTLGGLAGGLALGLGLTFLLEMRDTSMRSEQDVEFVLRLPVLAMIPAIEVGGAAKLPTAGRGTVEPPLSLGART